MKQYTGALKPETAKKLQANMQVVKKFLAGPKALGKTTKAITSIEDTIEKYNPGITEDEIKAWVWYRKSLGIPMKAWKKYDVPMTESYTLKLVQNKVLFFDPTTKSLVPFPVFVYGNIYEKIGKLSKFEEDIVSNYGQSVFNNHIKTLNEFKPKQISIQNPIEGERPIILSISETARTFIITSLRSDSGVVLTEPTDLQDAFSKWLRQYPDENIKKTNSYEIISYYINNENKPRNIDKIEWGAIKKITRDEGERLFKLFLFEALETYDQLRIDADYNSKYNATAPLQYQKIPIGLEISTKIGGGFDLAIKPAQREGIAFMELVGSGIIAFDVGVGKTITAICEVASAIKNGKCKRPLIVVPNPTYKNWINETVGNIEEGLFGVLSNTGIQLNEWYNLGADYDHINLDKAVPEGSITLVTYEGLNKIGFNEHTQAEHFSQLSDVLGQRAGGSDRDREKENESFREIIGVGLKETIADIETLGFDYVVVDEAHNFKNVFSQVKSDENNNKHFQIQGGQPSNRAIKLFFLCNFIQRRYGRNVMLLTATPFTNSPLEIYSMLSFVAYDYMVKNNILHLRQFFEQYIQETAEYVVGIDGEISQKNVVKSFNNRISLQKLINSHINFKTGEEANIPRPCKINLPKTTNITDKGLTKLDKDDQILTYLKLNDQQQANQTEINEEASKGASKDDPGRLLRLMSQSLNNALTPFLYSGKPKDYVDFVENSPKILYTMECIREVKQWHEKRGQEVSGQVIYIDRGKDFFKYIKEYLNKELGYKTNQPLKSNPKLKVDEVEFVTGGMPAAKKEKIKDAFNEGVCKIIIGTSTIKEGINLQKKSTVLYNLYPNWNPTDIRQLEGRIWRQKNEFGYVRIVMPLMENSMDVFVFQKLDEKTSRINDLWSKSDRGNVLDEESLDPNEVKFALVTDINVLVRFELKQIKEEMDAKYHILTKQIEDLGNYTTLKANYSSFKEKIVAKISNKYNTFQNLEVHYANGIRTYFRDIVNLKIDEQTKEMQNKIERYSKVYAQLNDVLQGNHEDKDIIAAYSAHERVNDGYSFGDYDFNRYKDTVSQLGKLQRTLFSNRGYDENTNIDHILKELNAELEALKLEAEDVKSDGFMQKLYNSVKAEKERLSIKGGDLETRVKEFASLNHLLSYKFKDVDFNSCYIPTIENKTQNTDKEKRLKLAQAKMRMAKAKLVLIAA